MILNYIFLISGLALAALIGAKMLEDRRKAKPILLRLISLGDERVRNLSHGFARHYSELKERTGFFLGRQVPLHTRNFMNKVNAKVKEQAEKRIGDIRGSKLLKKSDGLSEYFKSISEKENEGRIDDGFELPADPK